MNLYEVKFSTIIEVEADDDSDIGSIEGAEPEFEQYEKTDKFHICARWISDAFLDAMKFLDGGIGEGEYEIISISKMEDIFMVNYPEEECPFCGVEEAGEDDILKFKCWCGKDIVVKETGWKEINCPECGKEIPRDRLVGSRGNYILLDIDKDNKEK
jgi:predicted RNA-binding Zn-ribbon protein involved in translation (DUF1610 family)